MKKLKVLFFGTDDISLSALEALSHLDYEIVAVVTRADSLSNRKKEIIFSPVKQFAIEKGYKIFQPIKLKDEAEEILKTNPDLILTCSYGKIIPELILNYPQYKCINIHPSLLPKYRGASPIQAAIMNNDSVTGISFIYMTKDLDNGPILCQETINCDKGETTFSLKEKIKKLIALMMQKYFTSFFSKKVKYQIQDESKVSYVGMINHKDEQINWNKDAKTISGLVRALYDKPIAYTILNNNIVKVYEAQITSEKSNAESGTIIAVDKTGISVATTDYIIKLIIVQLAGKKPMRVKDLINGNHIFKINSRFSSNN